MAEAVDLLGGTVEVESEVGHGSVFRVWTPREVTSLGEPALPFTFVAPAVTPPARGSAAAVDRR